MSHTKDHGTRYSTVGRYSKWDVLRRVTAPYKNAHKSGHNEVTRQGTDDDRPCTIVRLYDTDIVIYKPLGGTEGLGSLSITTGGHNGPTTRRHIMAALGRLGLPCGLYSGRTGSNMLILTPAHNGFEPGRVTEVEFHNTLILERDSDGKWLPVGHVVSTHTRD